LNPDGVTEITTNTTRGSKWSPFLISGNCPTFKLTLFLTSQKTVSVQPIVQMINLNEIYPLIVPGEYSKSGAWDLPHHTFTEEGYILTWVSFKGQGSMIYITQSIYNDLETNHPGWQQKAFDNLRMSIGDNENFFTQYKLSSDGRLIFLVFLNADGIGSSRILLSNELIKAFPSGYYIAIPDRSCGMIIPKNINRHELKELEVMVKRMHKNATIPMSGKLFSPESFRLPEEWITASKPELTKIIVEEIDNLQGR
jgi:hypothetical protein